MKPYNRNKPDGSYYFKGEIRNLKKFGKYSKSLLRLENNTQEFSKGLKPWLTKGQVAKGLNAWLKNT